MKCLVSAVKRQSACVQYAGTRNITRGDQSRTVGNEAPEVPPNYAVPGRAFPRVKLNRRVQYAPICLAGSDKGL
jgi:hypothetical protein